MLEEGVEAGADEEVAVVAEPPQAVRLSRAAAATPATVKVVRFIDCISILLVSADLACRGQFACRLRPFPTWWAPALAGVSLCIRALPRRGWVDLKEFFWRGRRRAEMRGFRASQSLKRRNPGRCGPGSVFSFVHLCARGDLNPHARRHRNLNPACLPISPLARGGRSRNLRRRLPGSIVAPACGGSGQPPEPLGIKLEVTAQLRNMPGRPDVVLRQGHLALRVHHNG